MLDEVTRIGEEENQSVHQALLLSMKFLHCLREGWGGGHFEKKGKE